MDKILFETLELPDLRIADKAGPFDIFLPWYTRKSQIVNPQKVERDWLTNKFMAKPDYEDPHKKVFYATFAGMKVGKYPSYRWMYMSCICCPRLTVYPFTYFSCPLSCTRSSFNEVAKPNESHCNCWKELCLHWYFLIIFFSLRYLRFSHLQLFSGGIFLTYGAVVSMVANLRGKKDDIFNHAAGGASLGFIFGFTSKDRHFELFLFFDVSSLFSSHQNDALVKAQRLGYLLPLPVCYSRHFTKTIAHLLRHSSMVHESSIFSTVDSSMESQTEHPAASPVHFINNFEIRYFQQT